MLHRARNCHHSALWPVMCCLVVCLPVCYFPVFRTPLIVVSSLLAHTFVSLLVHFLLILKPWSDTGNSVSDPCHWPGCMDSENKLGWFCLSLVFVALFLEFRYGCCFPLSSLLSARWIASIALFIRLKVSTVSVRALALSLIASSYRSSSAWEFSYR